MKNIPSMTKQNRYRLARALDRIQAGISVFQRSSKVRHRRFRPNMDTQWFPHTLPYRLDAHLIQALP